jgi:CRISPR/Cas system CSM-associated protein Csm4 (group 5 of RAMP superfamily)
VSIIINNINLLKTLKKKKKKKKKKKTFKKIKKKKEWLRVSSRAKKGIKQIKLTRKHGSRATLL